MGQNHQKSINLEFRIRNVFSCGRGGLGGIVDADFIDRSPYLVMVASLTHIYEHKNEEDKEKIKEFISDYMYYSNYSLDEIAKEKDFNEIIKRFMKLTE